MIHSIDPLYEEPVSLAMKNGKEFIKDHVHPPGAASCPICGEDKHGVKINSNGVFHTAKTLMTNNSNSSNNNNNNANNANNTTNNIKMANSNYPGDGTLTVYNGNMSRQDSSVSLKAGNVFVKLISV